MVLKLYGNPMSTCTKRVALVLYEKNILFEFYAVDFQKGEHKAPEFLEKQPFGQVPYLDDDGFILYESRAIGRYLAEKYADEGTRLIPTDLQKKALFEQAASIENANFDVYAAPAVYEILFKPFMGSTPNPERFKELIAALAVRLDAYDKILAKQKYLAGDVVTLADLFHIPYAVLLPAAGSNVIEERPNVARWLKDLTERQSWKAVRDGIKPIAA